MLKTDKKKVALFCDMCGWLIAEGSEEGIEYARHSDVEITKFWRQRIEYKDENGEEQVDYVNRKKVLPVANICPECFDKLNAQIEATRAELMRKKPQKMVY